MTRKRHILIVDDEPGMLRSVSRVLRRDHDITTAESGEDALEKIQERTPDLAIVDIRMPGINGFELTRRLKQHDPDLDVILMTGNAEEPDDNLIQAIDGGAFYFITKPFDRRVLLTLVNRCLACGTQGRRRRSVSSTGHDQRGSHRVQPFDTGPPLRRVCDDGPGQDQR